MTPIAASVSAPRFLGWHMVARAFLTQNIATGFLIGTFGTTMLAVQARFDSNRATISLGMVLALLTMAILSPFIGKMIDRVTLRWTMVCGLSLSMAGYAGLAIAPSSLAFLLAYALLIGPGFAMTGPLPASILASNWFVAQQGRAVGIACTSLFTTIAPVLTIGLLHRYGLTAFYFCLAAVHVLLLPLVLTIVDRPGLIGQRAFGSDLATSTVKLPDSELVAPPLRLLARKAFWIMIVGGGMLDAAGIFANTHLVALATDRGLNPVQASMLMAVLGGSCMLGATLLGILCDRIGAALSLALAAAGYCAAWSCIFMTTWLPALTFAVALHGLCAGGIFPAAGVLSRHLFGAAAMARAVGLFVFLTMPLVFCFSPFAGWIRDTTHSYDAVILIVMVGTGLVSAAFLGLWRAER